MADPNIAMSRTESPATQSFHTVCNAKALFDSTWSNTLEAQLAAEATALGRSTATADFEEAVAAFIAKREPRFKGE